MMSEIKTTQLFVQHLIHGNNKENIEAQHHWPFVMGIYRWPVDSIPLTKGQ